MTQANGSLALVAGGAGFIGSHLCRALLDRGQEVLCVDNLLTSRPSNLRGLVGLPRFTFIEADVVNALPAEVIGQAHRISRVYNLACAASPPQYQADPEHTMLTNVVGTHHLLRLAERAGARFLLTSTSEVYGDPEVHPQQEAYRGCVSCTGPRACYDEGKRAAEALTFDYARLGRAEVRVARIFNTYGPNMHPDDGRVVSNLVCQALSGRAITVHGDGTQTRSFCYVSDMVEGLIRLMESDIDGCEPINLGNPVEMMVKDLLGRILDIVGTDSVVVHKPLPQDDPRRRRPDISRAKALLGWEPMCRWSSGWRAPRSGSPRRSALRARSGMPWRRNRNVVEMMRAAVLAAPGEMRITRVPVPAPGPGEVRIRLEGCGVCASNLEPWAGLEWLTYPGEAGGLGHEGWGIVDAVGADVAGLGIGDRVAALSFRSFADYDVANADAVVKLPAALAGSLSPASRSAARSTSSAAATSPRGRRW